MCACGEESRGDEGIAACVVGSQRCEAFADNGHCVLFALRRRRSNCLNSKRTNLFQFSVPYQVGTLEQFSILLLRTWTPRDVMGYL